MSPFSPLGWASRLLGQLREISGSSLRPLAWTMTAHAATQGALFATNFGVARLLGRSSFGEWATLWSTINAVAGIAQLSMALTATKYAAQYKASDPGRAGSVLALCGVVTIATGVLSATAMVLGADYLAGSVFQAPQLVSSVRVAALGVFFVTIGGYQIGALAGLEQFRAAAVLALANSVVAVGLVVGGAASAGVPGAVGGFAGSQLFSWATHRYVLQLALRRTGITVGWRGVGREVSEVASFTLPATLSGVAGMLGLWGSSVALVRTATGYSEMALFAAASTFRGVVLFAPAVIQRVSGAVLTAMSGRGEDATYRRALASNVLATLLSASAAALPIVVLGRWLLLLFGGAFREGGWVVALLALAGVLEATTTALCQDFVTSSRMWTNLGVFATRAALLTGLTAVLSPTHGAVGAAWAAVAAHAGAVALSVATARPRGGASPTPGGCPAPSRSAVPSYRAGPERRD